MKTVAVIPCLNEERHITDVVKTAKKYVDIVLVSDGGSIDNTVELAKQAGARVYIGNTDNKRGYGANMRAGMIRAIHKENAKVLVILDGDGQHDPHEIPLLLKPVIEHQADVVLGNRIGQDGMPAYRLLGNRVLSFVCNFRARKPMPDAVVGFWAFRASALPKLEEKQWGVCVEMLIKMRANGCRMASVPIKPIYHIDYKDNSTLGPVKLALLLFWAIIKWRIKCRC